MLFLGIQCALLVATLVVTLAVLHAWGSRIVWLRTVAASLWAHGLVTVGVIFVGGYYAFYDNDYVTVRFTAKYTALYAVAVATLIIVGRLLAKRGILTLDRTRRTWVDIVIGLLTVLFFGAAAVITVMSRWFTAFFGKVGGAQLVFLLTDGGAGDTPKDTTHQINHYMIVPAIIAIILAVLIALWHSKLGVGSGEERHEASSRSLRSLAAIVAFTSLIASTIYCYTTLPIQEIIDSQTPSSFIEDNYVEPTLENVTPGDHPRNLVHILMESMENSYYDKAEGGYMDTNLMPDLAELTKQNVSFSHTEKFGGPHQTVGAEHSIAAIINMWAGIPMKNDGSRVPERRPGYAHFTTLGDILHHYGYQTEWMMGADASWGALDAYFPEHGDLLVFDHQYAIDQGLIPEDYNVWWGFEDDKLYDWAKNEMTRMASSDDPFYLAIENADTHFPDGYVSANMKDTVSDKQYGNVIHYSQQQTVELIKWIQAQPFAKDTTIVVTGDHRSMDQTFFEGWDPSYERTTVNVIINGAPGDPGTQVTQNRQYAPFDFFPTILTSIGMNVEGGRLGLGTDLYSGEPTLIERDGLDQVNRELNMFSRFYHTHEEAADFRPQGPSNH